MRVERSLFLLKRLMKLLAFLVVRVASGLDELRRLHGRCVASFAARLSPSIGGFGRCNEVTHSHTHTLLSLDVCVYRVKQANCDVHHQQTAARTMTRPSNHLNAAAQCEWCARARHQTQSAWNLALDHILMSRCVALRCARLSSTARWPHHCRRRRRRRCLKLTGKVRC